MTTSFSAFRVPEYLSLALRPLPLLPLEIALRRLAASILARHPTLLDRLGREGARRFGIELLDLPFAIVIEIVEGTVVLSVVRQLDASKIDARIAGNLVSLMDLVDGRHDGDARFFSRDIMVEGDMEAVLALRNAIDDAELDLVQEAAQLAGPFSALAEWAAGSAMRVVARVGGLPRGLGQRAG